MNETCFVYRYNVHGSYSWYSRGYLSLMSSFRRSSSGAIANPLGANVAPIKILGTKPNVSTGLGFASSGHKQLDELLGGGVALGTVLLLENDVKSNYGDTLMSYCIAESISMKHATLLVTHSERHAAKLFDNLPFNQSMKIDTDEDPKITLEEDKLNGTENTLQIAWQYAKYSKTSEETARTSSSSYCCSYDLSRRYFYFIYYYCLTFKFALVVA